MNVESRIPCARVLQFYPWLRHSQNLNGYKGHKFEAHPIAAPVAQWIRRPTTDRKIPSSTLGGGTFCFRDGVVCFLGCFFSCICRLINCCTSFSVNCSSFYFWFPLHPLPPPSVTGVAFAVRSSFIPIHKPQGARWAKDKDQKDKRHLTPAYF